MSKHTPGPWGQRGTPIFEVTSTNVVYDQDESAIAVLTDRGHATFSNACLIAAAPDMLGKLEKVAALYNPDREPARDLGLRMEMMEELHDEVMETIREAKGETDE